MFSPESVAKATIGGKATPFGIENISLNTNLLELIEADGGPESTKFLKNLAAGNHMSQTDTILTNYMVRFILDGSLDLAQGTAHLSDQIKEVRRSIAKAAPLTPTTNIAHVQHMSDAVFNYVTKTDEGIKGIKLGTDTGSTISFSQREGKFIETSVDQITKEVSETPLDYRATKARIQQEMQLFKDLDPNSQVIDTGVSYGQQSRALGVLDGISRASGISAAVKTSPMDLVQAMINGGDAEIDQRLIEGLAATREHLGFTDFHSRPEIFEKTGILRNISKTFGYASEAQKGSYLETLSKSGIGGVIDDPYLRRSFVELATVTSSIPYQVDSAGKAVTDYAAPIIQQRHAAKQAKHAAFGEILNDLSESDLTARVNAFNEVGRKNANLLSEFGVSHFQEQKTIRLYGQSPDKMGRVMLPTSMLKEIEVTGSGGSKYKLFSDEFMADYKVNKFGLSALDDGQRVNVVLGDLAGTERGTVMSEARAKEISSQVVDQLEDLFSRVKTSEELVKLGHFADEDQAKLIRAKLAAGTDTVKQEMTDSLTKYALTTHNATGQVAEGISAIMGEMGDNDVLPAQRGITLAMSQSGEGYASFQGRIDDTTVRILDLEGPDSAAAAAKIRSGQAAQEVMDAYNATSGRMAEQTSFRTAIKKNLASKGLGRSARDEFISETYKRLKPKIGLAALGVGVAAVGYYMYNKSQESNMYDETMEDQPIEANGQIRRANSSFQSSAGMTSSRRDPLTTAGVVGNLDRNKIGHTRMGPDKYNHLYGG